MKWRILYVYKREYKHQSKQEIIFSDKFKSVNANIYRKFVRLPDNYNSNKVENWFNCNYVNKKSIFVFRLLDR